MTVPVEVLMGSRTDLEVMRGATEALDDLGVASVRRVVSAHRTPHDLLEHGRTAADRGVQVLIAGAGGAAHLPGMLAAVTRLPVIGVPVPTTHLNGVDSLLSIAQMPTGIPVATTAIGGARNAGILAARILALSDPELAERLDRYAEQLADLARTQDLELQESAR